MAKAVFHPAWIPESLDPSVERLKRVRIFAGAVAALGVYTFVQGRFDFTEVLENMLTASAVLLFITPLTVGVMLFVWRRTRVAGTDGALADRFPRPRSGAAARELVRIRGRAPLSAAAAGHGDDLADGRSRSDHG
ncbi:hypothetical protein [Streptomyces sp. NPDC001914]|uniref:hypothetical protein n=1 Tax=Streptomyces sp. NPDC001914 TaxID=3364623 RepID=UPI003695512B